MELIDVLDENGNKTGRVKSKDQIHKDGDWHAVAQVWIYDDNKQLLIHQRSFDKVLYPSRWSGSAAGHVDAGESIEDGIIRETKEELGIDLDKNKLVKITEKSTVKEIPALEHFDREIKHVFIYHANLSLDELTLDPKEVQNVRWIKSSDLINELKKQKENKQGPKKYIPYPIELIELIEESMTNKI